jgi:hypothetical protein
MSPIQRGELENIANAQIAAIVVLSRHLKWIKSSLRSAEFCPPSHGASRAMFTAANTRHNFAIWGIKNNADTRPQRHLYYCIRCKQAFSVDDRGGWVTPLDSQGNAIHGDEAIRRRNTFGGRPCPGLQRSHATTAHVENHTDSLSTRALTELSSAGRRALKARVAHWHQWLKMNRTSWNARSKRK